MLIILLSYGFFLSKGESVKLGFFSGTMTLRHLRWWHLAFCVGELPNSKINPKIQPLVGLMCWYNIPRLFQPAIAYPWLCFIWNILGGFS